MTPEEEVLLRDIGVLLLGNLAGFTAMTLVYGVFVLLFSISTYKISNRPGKRTLLTNCMLTTSCLTFVLATLYWCAYLASFATLVRGILVDTDIGPLDTGSYDGINAKDLHFSRMQNWSAQLLPLFSDGVVLWRAWSLYPGQHLLMAIPATLFLGTFASGLSFLGIVSAQDKNIVGPLGASSIWENTFISYLTLSLATNLVCTALITHKVWNLKWDSSNLGSHPKNQISQTRLVSIFLVESGVVYAVTQVINIALEFAKSRPDSSLYFSSLVITSVYTVCTSMYPTIVALLLCVQRSISHIFGFVPVINTKPDGVAVNSAAAPGPGGPGAPTRMGGIQFAHSNQQTTFSITGSVSTTPQVVSLSGILLNNDQAGEKPATIYEAEEKPNSVYESSEEVNEKQTKTAPF